MMKDVKRTVLGVGLALLMIWAALLVMHLLLALVWVFFWVGLIGVLVALVLHALERFV